MDVEGMWIQIPLKFAGIGIIFYFSSPYPPLELFIKALTKLERG